MTRVRVAIETQFAVGTATGLGVYAKQLATALRRRDDIEVSELCDPSFDLWRFDRRLYWDQMRLPSLARRSGADIVHCTGGTMPWRCSKPIVLTLHDLVWLRGRNRGRFYVRWYFGKLAPALARRAAAIVCDTEAARLDVADGLGIEPSHIFVAGVGVEERYFSLERKPAEPPFALAVGTVEERKDLATAVRMLPRLPDIRLIAAGPVTPYAQEVLETARRCGVADRVELRGYVDESALMDLYAGAALLVFPSRYEGFGLPPLQALACGLPVVAARTSVSEEVLGDCAWYAEAGADEAFARLCAAVIDGEPEVRDRIARGKVRAASWTWPRVAARSVEIYRHVAALSTKGARSHGALEEKSTLTG